VTTIEEARRVAELERENREMKRANETPHTAIAFSRRRNSTSNR